MDRRSVLYYLVIGLFVSLVRGAQLIDPNYRCPQGLDCVGPSICGNSTTTIPSVVCTPGYLCGCYPNGTSYSIMCPPKYYCPTPAEQIPCPSGSYCHGGSTAPSKCEPLSICPKKTSRRKWVLLPLVVFALLAACGALMYYWYRRSRRANPKPVERAEKRDEVALYVQRDNASKVDVEFRHLRFELQNSNTGGKNRVLIQDVSGSFRHGRVGAILGPSGAGKTTLMNLLAGKLNPTSGEILVNGDLKALSQLRGQMGYVPQDNILMSMLTVQEAIEHSARIRLPSNWSREDRHRLVNEVIEVLGLTHVRHSVIGDENERGISGGERRRVNIGVELVAAPAVLLLDEPTSGLDAAAADEVMGHIRAMAIRFGLCVVAVLHQPRFEMLQSAETDILLLAPGGRTVFCGSAEGAIDHFNKIGLPAAARVNPADHWLDVIAGRAPGVNVSVDELHGRWRAREAEGPRIALVPREILAAELTPAAVQQREAPSLWRVTLAYLWRSILVQWHQPEYLMLEIGNQIITGLGLGVAAIARELYEPALPLDIARTCPPALRYRCISAAVRGDDPGVTAFFITMVVGAVSAVGATRTFAPEKQVYLREAYAGTSSVAYFLARCIYDIVNIVLLTVVFLGFYYVLAGPTGAFQDFFATFLLLNFAAYGLGYLVSNITTPDRAMVYACIAGITWSVTSGAAPKLNQVRKWGPLQIFWWISYNRWSSESFYISVVKPYAKNPSFRVNQVSADTGYDYENQKLDYLALLLIGIAYRLAAWFFLKYTHAEKQGSYPIFTVIRKRVKRTLKKIAMILQLRD